MIGIAKKIVRNYVVCDHCLGRQFSQLMTGTSNKRRGRAVRLALALEYEKKPFRLKTDNFYNIKLRKQKISPKPRKKPCDICNNIFDKFPEWEKLIKKVTKAEFNTFLIGTNITNKLVDKEEEIWRVAGIKYTEPIKSEINREFGKYLEKRLKKKVDLKYPDILFIINLNNNRVRAEINPLYIFGLYQKLKRGLPQTKWEKFPETVEDIVAKPLMKVTKGKSHAFHGCGREDRDARCLGWRPFVIQIDQPVKRRFSLKRIQSEINKTKKVKVKGLKPSSRAEIVKIKEAKPEKTYRVLVEFKTVPKDLQKLKNIKTISQKTPQRVMHRRADLIRKRKVFSLKWKKKTGKRYEFTIRTEAGLYIKELVTGDETRTKPSFSELLNNKAKVVELDVIGIHWKKYR